MLALVAPVLFLAACSSSNPTDPSGSGEAESGGNSSPDLGAASNGDTVALSQDQMVACDAPLEHIQQRSLRLINEARAQARNCGTTSFKATTAVSWNTTLVQAANKHSVDMAQHNFFDHTGSDGSDVGTRVDATGYNWSNVGENIAAGQIDADEVIAGWLDSPGHCVNLMNPSFTELSVSCVEDEGADFTRYWTNVLAAPSKSF